MTCDRFHLLQDFLHFNGKVNSTYALNDRKRGCCHQVCLFTDMKLYRKLYYPKKQLIVSKSLVLFKCQFHFKQYIKEKRVCFEKRPYKLTSSNGTTLNFSVNSRKRMFQNGNENSDMSAHQKEPFSPNISFLLLVVTSDIPSVSGKNDAIKRLSSVRYFS